MGARPQPRPVLRAEQAVGGLLHRQCQRLPWGWTIVLTGQWPVLVVQGLGKVLNSEIMLVTLQDVSRTNTSSVYPGDRQLPLGV